MYSRCASLLVLLLCLVILAGCEATAQEAIEETPEVSTNSATATDTTSASYISTRRILDTRATLLNEGLIRDSSGVVSSAPCSQHEELIFNVPSPPLCEEITIESLGVTYRAFLFSQSHDVLVIYHEGHMGCTAPGVLAENVMPDANDLISLILQRADVLYFDMPLLATNCGQKIHVNGTTYSGTLHSWFALLDKPGESALAYFFNHIHSALDYLGPRYRTIHMTGRSGGGWATTIYAALDWRITRSVSVAGSLPIELRTPDLDGVDDLGDWEQYGPHIFRLLSYQALYEAAGGISEPRRHVLIYNEFDNCCFSGVKGVTAGEQYVSSSEGFNKERVAFLVNRGEWEHAIPAEMVVEQLFGP